MSPSRREVIFGGVAAALAGTAGAATGQWYGQKHANWEADAGPFRAESRAIREKHAAQTVEIVEDLRARWAKPVFGDVSIWRMIENLGQIVDPTDTIFYCVSQHVHVRQMLAAMERDGVKDEVMILGALLHDLGKAVAIERDVPDEIFGTTMKVGDPKSGAGLDAALYQFGHPEIIWMRLKDHVAPELAWLLRYHGVPDEHLDPFMNDNDRKMRDTYLTTFRKYDLWTKSMVEHPKVDWKKYRDLIERKFPKPIPF